MNPGEVIGSYRLLARLAHGGMGEVWEAEGPKGLVAVKLIPEFLMSDPALVERLNREAEALKRLDHPGIVRIFEFGQVEGRAYLAMELLKGETLAGRLVRESPLPVMEVERIAGVLAETLAYLHSRDIIHRDLKPQNIFLTEDGGVKLIDLGVAKVLDEASLTVTGSHFGTPAYMAPEAFRDAKGATAATDIWSFGVILYEMATGRLPFPGTTAASIIAKISDTNMTPQSPTHLRPEVSGKLAQTIEKCLNRDPAKRPTAGDIASQSARRTAKRQEWTLTVFGRKYMLSDRVVRYIPRGLAIGVIVGTVYLVQDRRGPRLPSELFRPTDKSSTAVLLPPDRRFVRLNLTAKPDLRATFFRAGDVRLKDGRAQVEIAGRTVDLRIMQEGDENMILEIDGGRETYHANIRKLQTKRGSVQRSVHFEKVLLGSAGMQYTVIDAWKEGEDWRQSHLQIHRDFIWQAPVTIDGRRFDIGILDQRADGMSTEDDEWILRPAGQLSRISRDEAIPVSKPRIETDREISLQARTDGTVWARLLVADQNPMVLRPSGDKEAVVTTTVAASKGPAVNPDFIATRTVHIQNNGGTINVLGKKIPFVMTESSFGQESLYFDWNGDGNPANDEEHKADRYGVSQSDWEDVMFSNDPGLHYGIALKREAPKSDRGVLEIRPVFFWRSPIRVNETDFEILLIDADVNFQLSSEDRWVVRDDGDRWKPIRGVVRKISESWIKSGWELAVEPLPSDGRIRLRVRSAGTAADMSASDEPERSTSRRTRPTVQLREVRRGQTSSRFFSEFDPAKLLVKAGGQIDTIIVGHRPTSSPQSQFRAWISLLIDRSFMTAFNGELEELIQRSGGVIVRQRVVLTNEDPSNYVRDFGQTIRRDRNVLAFTRVYEFPNTTGLISVNLGPAENGRHTLDIFMIEGTELAKWMGNMRSPKRPRAK